MPDVLVVNLLVLAVSGLTSVLVGLVFKRLGDVAADVKALGDKVGTHAERLATAEARISSLEAHGCLYRRECQREEK